MSHSLCTSCESRSPAHSCKSHAEAVWLSASTAQLLRAAHSEWWLRASGLLRLFLARRSLCLATDLLIPCSWHSRFQNSVPTWFPHCPTCTVMISRGITTHWAHTGLATSSRLECTSTNKRRETGRTSREGEWSAAVNERGREEQRDLAHSDSTVVSLTVSAVRLAVCAHGCHSHTQVPHLPLRAAGPAKRVGKCCSNFKYEMRQSLHAP